MIQSLSPVIAVFCFTIIFPYFTFANSALPLYEAEYKTKLWGISLVLKRVLVEEEGRYHLSQSGTKALLGSINEDSFFSLSGKRIVGEKFVYQLKGITNRRREVLFNEEAGVIHSLRKTTWTELVWSPEILDRLSLQEQFRINLLNSSRYPELVSLKVVDGSNVKVKQFELVEEVLLNTAVGSLNTLRYKQQHNDPSKRRSETWLAIDHSFLMVKTDHTENGLKTSIELTRGHVGGVPIVGSEQ